MGVARAIGAVIVGGVAVFAGTQSFDDDTTRNEAGSIVESGGLGAYAVQIGDCISDPGLAELVQSVEGVPCSEPHFAEAYARFDILDHVDYPTRSEMDRVIGRGCVSRWREAIGTAYESDSELDFTALSPTAESWEAGDREVLCLVISVDGDVLVGSKRRAS